MRRTVLLIIILMAIVLLVAYIAYPNASTTFTNGNIPLNEVPQVYRYFEAKENGDVVIWGDEYFNIEKIDIFLENIYNKKKDKLRIAHYTVEGDPIMYDIYYNGKTIKCTIDYSRDKFSSKERRAKKDYVNIPPGENQIDELIDFINKKITYGRIPIKSPS